MQKNVISKIAEEHFKIRQLMKTVLESSNNHDKSWAFIVLKHEIIEHMAGEEQSIYLHTGNLNLDRTYDHHDIKECLQRLNLIKIDDPNWDEAFKSFCQVVENHCGDEEENLFHAINNYFDTDLLITMEKEYNLGRLLSF
jgi:hemerythrin superfamily protein